MKRIKAESSKAESIQAEMYMKHQAKDMKSREMDKKHIEMDETYRNG